MSEPLFPGAEGIHALRLSDLEREATPETDWLWQGYLAGGNLTLLTSQWKTGKTTLLALLLDRLRKGGELAGSPVKPGRAAVVSEEPASLWLRRGRRFNYRHHVWWICRPFKTQPNGEQWLALIEHLLSLHRQAGLSLVAVDPLASFFPLRSENDAVAMIAALMPLQRLTSAGVSVLVLHHPRKAGGMEGQSARGSGALCAHVDVLLELHWYRSANEEGRRRRLLAWSRYEETPRQRVLELSEDGRDYRHVEDVEADELTPLREALWRVLESARTKQSREEIVDNWPPDWAPPHPVSLGRLLERCVERGELKRDGKGVKTDPYRYWLKSLERLWETDVVARVQQQVADARRDVCNRTAGL